MDKAFQGVRFVPQGVRPETHQCPIGSAECMEFAPFTEDGKGLNYEMEYEHISVDPAYNDREAQLVTVN